MLHDSTSSFLRWLVKKSMELDLTKPEFSMPLSKIIDIAYSQLTKITGAEEGWKASTITINKWGAKREKWFYAVGFDNTSSIAFANISILVTVDGQLGVVKEVTEKVIN